MQLSDFYGRLGVTQGPDGPRLRVWSAHATRIEVCLLGDHGRIETVVPLAPAGKGVWEVSHHGLQPGRRYALRADGPEGGAHDFDETRLLVDPYARGVEPLGDEADPLWVGVVVADEPFDWGDVERPRHDLEDVVVYETHVAGFTRLAPHLPPELRGTYAGFAHEETIRYLRDTGVNAVELLPVHAFASERFLRRQGMRNYWGYNTVGFFAPHAAYASPAARAAGHEAVVREFKGMVRNLHAAGIEVYLDVVYNHTAEEGADGPTMSLRGLDNQAYYRHDGQGNLIDVTGCGNSINASHAAVQQLVLDSLMHWTNEFHIDGFRFDLAATLGRNGGVEFDPEHPLLTSIVEEPRLSAAKIFAEPWDVGFGGWQTGNFPVGWSEWNDRYRDRLRSFWIGDLAHARHTGVHLDGVGPFVTAAAGSSNLFGDERGPLASVNFVTAHDGFTLRDLVSYNVKHNLLNGELGRDGTTNNHSYNFGYEGVSRDPGIEADRRLAMRNLLGSLLLSAGVPMLTMGDEVARSQGGNNNPYNQDNETTWFDWAFDERQLAQRAHVARLVELRRSHPALRPRAYNHGDDVVEFATRKDWYDGLGATMRDGDWNQPHTRTVQCLAATIVPLGERRLLTEHDGASAAPDALGPAARGHGRHAVPHGYALDELLIVVHGTEDTALVRLPDPGDVADYSLLWDSTAEHVEAVWANSEQTTVAPGTMLRVPGPSLRVYRANPASH